MLRRLMRSRSPAILPNELSYGANRLVQQSQSHWHPTNRSGESCLRLPSPPDVGARHYRFVPVRLFMKDQFRSDLRVGNVTVPVLVVHGENDFVVPMTLGKRLYGLIRAPKRFVSIAGAGHNDLGSRAVAAAKEFIAEQ
jgi:fermentation-respiration switch protein FrsA (DUF1100 family)